MKKMLTYVVVLGVLLYPVPSFAAFNDATLTTAVVINVGGFNLTVLGGSTTIESIVVNAGSFDVAMQSGSSFAVFSSDWKSFIGSISGTGITKIESCEPTRSTLTLSSTGAGTITLTPAGTCVAGSSAFVYLGCTNPLATNFNRLANKDDDSCRLPGETAATTQFVVTTLTTPATSTTPVISASPATHASDTPMSTADREILIAKIMVQIEVLRAELAKLGGAGSTGSPQASPNANALLNANLNVSFKRDLSIGITGEDVRALQVWLNTHGYAVAQSGPGSSGNETKMFGVLTSAALVKFQIAHGITPAVGYFGPKTRAVVTAQ